MSSGGSGAQKRCLEPTLGGGGGGQGRLPREGDS